MIHNWSKITGSLNAQVFRACAQLNLRLSLQLAESTLLPLKMEPYAKVDNVNLTPSLFLRTKLQLNQGDGGWRGFSGEFWCVEPSEGVGNCYNPLGGGCLSIQVHNPPLEPILTILFLTQRGCRTVWCLCIGGGSRQTRNAEADQRPGQFLKSNIWTTK